MYERKYWEKNTFHWNVSDFVFYWNFQYALPPPIKKNTSLVLLKSDQSEIRKSALYWALLGLHGFNTLRPRQNGHHFTDNIFKYIFLNKNVRISIKISLNFVPKGPIDNIPALVQIMAWRRPGSKPLSEPMMIRLPTHIFVTRPHWVNSLAPG